MPTYKHNDYYGYINALQESAIRNPSWFWSESASKERQWLHDNGASAIIDNIYENTPDEIKSTINPKYLTSNIKTQQLQNEIHQGQNNFIDTAGAIGLQSAGTVGLGISLASNPITTGMGILGGVINGNITNNLVKRISKDTETGKSKYNNWGELFRRNKDWGQTGNMISDFTNPGMLIAGGLYGRLGSKFSQIKGIPNLETWTSSMRNKAREDWTSGLEAMQHYFKEKSSHYPEYTGFKTKTKPDVEFVESDPLATLYKGYDSGMKDSEVPLTSAMDLAKRINFAVDESQAAFDYAKAISDGSLTESTPDFSFMLSNLGAAPKNFPVGGSGQIKLAAGIPLWESFHDPSIGNTIGIKNNIMNPNWGFIKHPFRSSVGHELHHANRLFNTFKNAEPREHLTNESPFYGMDYSKIPESTKQLLTPKYRFNFKLNPHDSELAESYSDLGGVKTMLDKYGLLKDNKVSLMNLLNYKYLKGGWRERFFLQHPGLKRQYQALNAEIPIE